MKLFDPLQKFPTKTKSTQSHKSLFNYPNEN